MMSTEEAVADIGVGSEQLDAFAQADSGAEASAGGGGSDKTAAAAEEFGLPEDFLKNALESDPEMKALIEGKKPGEDKKGSEGHDAEGESGEDSAADGQKQEPSADEKDSGNEEAPAPFADDVIPGLKGEVFGKLPEEAQEAVAKFYEEAQEKTRKAESLEATLNTLKQDPLIRSRIAAAEAGVTVPVRGVSQAEAQSIAGILIEKLGLDAESEAGAITDTVAALARGIEGIAQDMAQGYAGQSLQTLEALREVAEIDKQGDALLFGLSQFDKNLALKETNLAKFYTFDPTTKKTVFNEKHPEIEKYKNGLGKFVQWASDRGMDNRQIVKMGAKAFYAAAAADMGKAVTFNSADRDKKIAAEARKSVLNAFRKTGGGTLATQGTAPAGKSGQYIENGIDVTKLATDGSYFDELVAKRPGDMAWIDKLSELEAKGREIINRKQAR